MTILFFITSFALAQSSNYGAGSYGAAYSLFSCATPTPSGKIFTLNNMAGCKVVKKTESAKGDLVTVERVMPDPYNKGKTISQLQTFKTTTEDGRLASVSYANGDDLNRAATVMTAQYNPYAQDPNNNLVRQIFTQTGPNKDKVSYVTYDRNLCSRLKENSDLQADSIKLQVCSEFLKKYEDAISEYSKNLKKEKLNLGVPNELNQSGEPSYREAKSGRISDIIFIASTCYRLTMPNPLPSTEPQQSTPSAKSPPGLRNAVDATN